MSQTYDNTDSGAVFPPRDNHKMILTGKANNDGKESQMAITLSTLPDGRRIMDVYEKVGTLFENDKGDNQNAPDYTGPIGNRRVAAWKKTKDDMAYMSLSFSDKKQGGGNGNSYQQANTKIDDSIPF
jgi:hypothetical protein